MPKQTFVLPPMFAASMMFAGHHGFEKSMYGFA